MAWPQPEAHLPGDRGTPEGAAASGEEQTVQGLPGMIPIGIMIRNVKYS